jgi:predicted acetyltransferase
MARTLVEPTARLRDSWLAARGVATWALGAVLDQARTRGLDRVLVACAVDNVASARTIEANGGVLEDIRLTELGETRRYWIAT